MRISNTISIVRSDGGLNIEYEFFINGVVTKNDFHSEEAVLQFIETNPNMFLEEDVVISKKLV